GCNASLADSVHDLHADLMVSPDFGASRSHALYAEQVLREAEDYPRRAVASAAARVYLKRCSHGWRHELEGARARANSGASLSFASYGDSMGTTTISSPLTSPCWQMAGGGQGRHL
ncbi:hypothetical protein PFISCL1PPCAC_3917, partial [Pristionchus fissidentatus]